MENKDGIKRTITGPCVFKPSYGDKWSEKKDCVMVDINKYCIVKDNANSNSPIKHIKGPCKFYPQPYDEVVSIQDAIEINDTKAIWLLKTDAITYLLDTPMFYYPQPGEKVVNTVQKTVLQQHEFAIMISPDGQNLLKSGNIFLF